MPHIPQCPNAFKFDLLEFGFDEISTVGSRQYCDQPCLFSGVVQRRVLNLSSIATCKARLKESSVQVNT